MNFENQTILVWVRQLELELVDSVITILLGNLCNRGLNEQKTFSKSIFRPS